MAGASGCPGSLSPDTLQFAGMRGVNYDVGAGNKQANQEAGVPPRMAWRLVVGFYRWMLDCTVLIAVTSIYTSVALI